MIVTGGGHLCTSCCPNRVGGRIGEIIIPGPPGQGGGGNNLIHSCARCTGIDLFALAASTVDVSIAGLHNNFCEFCAYSNGFYTLNGAITGGDCVRWFGAFDRNPQFNWGGPSVFVEITRANDGKWYLRSGFMTTIICANSGPNGTAYFVTWQRLLGAVQPVCMDLVQMGFINVPILSQSSDKCGPASCTVAFNF
jgi:hypothetical protein